MTFRSTITPPSRVTITNTWDGVVAAAKAAGAKFPEVVAAQWALESGYGKHTSGKNNYFGLKGEGSDRETKEFINGQWISIVDGFIDFPDLQTCVTYLVDRWYRDYQRFKGVNRAGSPEECARLLVAEGYATDPQYSDKLIRLMRDNV
jgi:flagellum-specific peptidoglycan hydrolase FlgJ